MDSTRGEAISNWKWGYIILLSMFLINFMGSGVAKSFSVLLPNMVERFSGTYALLGFICNIPSTIMLFSGPLVSLVFQRVNHRLVAMVGGVMSGVCLVSSGFISNIVALGLIFSITGIGRACLYIPVSILLNEYFSDNYVLINTIASYGTTAGVMILPIITERSLEAYGYSGVFMILGAIMFNLVVAGAAIRKPIFRVKVQTDHQVKNDLDPSYSKSIGREQTEDEDSDDQKGHDKTSTLINDNSPHLLKMGNYQHEQNQSVEAINHDGERYKEVGDAGFDDNNQKHLPLISRNEVSDNSSKPQQDNSDTNVQCSLFISRCKLFMNKEILFMMSLPATFFQAYSIDAWVLFLVPHAEQLGIPQSRAVFLSSIGGIGGIVGRTISVIILAKKVNMFPIYIIFGLITSLTFFLDFAGKSFSIRSFLAFIQGFCFFILDTANANFLKSTLVDENNFSFGIGLSCFVYGVGSFSSGFITGALFDVIQCYTTVFMINGIALVFFTINIVFISVILERRTEST